MTDVLALLRRDDKWFLGQAPGLLFAPPAPVWLEHPGFWDAAHYLHFIVEPLFTYTLLDEALRPLPLRFVHKEWRPDRLVLTFETTGFTVQETRTCGPSDVVASTIKISSHDTHARHVTLLAWTAQPLPEDAFKDAGYKHNSVFIRREVTGYRNTRMLLTTALGLKNARSHNVQLSEATANQPHFHLSPYYETLGPHGLNNTISTTGVNQTGMMYTALECPLVLTDGTAQCTVVAAVAPDTSAALSLVKDALHTDMPAQSEAAWRTFFASVPQFECSDPYINTYYWYRWFGLRLNMITTKLGRYSLPAVAEGIGSFRVPISYSAQCHMLETRWMHTPDVAQGSFLNFARNQRDDGSFPGHIHTDFVAGQGIYHADWGARLLDVHHVHPDCTFLEEAYPALEAYVQYFYQERDPQHSGLYDHVNQWESGQEYMSRYVWVDAEGDEWKPMKRRLKGLDSSIYIYRIEKALAEIACLLNKPADEITTWRKHAQRTKNAILTHCWDNEKQAFMDASPELERSGLVLALSFYPFFTDIATHEHLPSLDRYLFNPDEFWTQYPVPASPKTDPYYSPTPNWKSKRTNCPWNGRTWPMTNSHIAEAIVGASRLNSGYRHKAVTFIQSFIKTLFFDGDVTRPNAFEHYNPDTGKASVYRGIDDYQHSWVVDLIIKYVTGVQPHAQHVIIDPLPFKLESFSLTDVRIRGQRIDIHKDAHGFRVSLNKTQVHSSADVEVVRLAI